MKKTIYLDNAATTKTRPEVVEAMLPYFTEIYGNPSSVYDFSAPAREAVAKALRLVPRRRIFISQQAVQNRITGR